MPDEFLTVQEVAKFLRVDPQTVYNWVDCGELAAVRVGKRRVRIRQAELDAFIAAGSQPAAQPAGPEPAVNDGDTADADGQILEAPDGLEGLDRAEIVEALDALSQAVQTLADRLR